MLPDASDECTAALIRQAHDGAIMALYDDIYRREVSSDDHQDGSVESLEKTIQDHMLAAQSSHVSEAAGQLLRKVVTAAQGSQKQVEMSPGKRLTITSGLALDAGFAAAWLNQGKGMRHYADDAKLKFLTEKCLSQRDDNATCFAIGYMHGALAYTPELPDRKP